jgi:hypothetical protein
MKRKLKEREFEIRRVGFQPCQGRHYVAPDRAETHAAYAGTRVYFPLGTLTITARVVMLP